MKAKDIWNNFDNFLYQYRYYIGGGLIIIILAGLGVLGYGKYYQDIKNTKTQELANLKAENDSLRVQLSSQAQQQVAGASISTSENQSGKININTADAAELDKIPNIGPTRAADIIFYRESKGGFKTIEEMKNIKGIGDKTFESMKDLITVGE